MENPDGGNPLIVQMSLSQRKIIVALIAGVSIREQAEVLGKQEKAVAQDLQRARDATGLTTYQLVAHVAADMVRAEAP